MGLSLHKITKLVLTFQYVSVVQRRAESLPVQQE